MNTNDFKSSKYKTKLLGNTVTHGNNSILKNTTIPVPLKFLSSFWLSLKISLINCKVELKLRLMKYCVLASVAVENGNANSNNIIFPVKVIKLYVPVVTLSAKDNQKLLKLLSKGFERSAYMMNIKQKVRIRISQMVEIFF